MDKTTQIKWLKISLTIMTFLTLNLLFLLVNFQLGWSIILSILLIIPVLFILFRTKGEKEVPGLKKLTKEKRDFYRSKNLSDEDITFFRNTMQEAKEHIVNSEKQLMSATKLQAINNRHNTTTILKDFFNKITQEPQAIHKVDQFLYVHLPHLDDLTKKYVEISNHKVKSTATLQILKKSAQTIDELSSQITDDYETFIEEDIDNLQSDIEVTNDFIDNNDI